MCICIYARGEDPWNGTGGRQPSPRRCHGEDGGGSRKIGMYGATSGYSVSRRSWILSQPAANLHGCRRSGFFERHHVSANRPSFLRPTTLVFLGIFSFFPSQ